MNRETRLFAVKLYDSPNNMKQLLKKVGRSAECGASKYVMFLLCIPLKSNGINTRKIPNNNLKSLSYNTVVNLSNKILKF